MAEVLAVVASGIAVCTLAAKVASCVVKLRDCWEQVKDVPADISNLLYQIECYEHILFQIQESSRLPGLVFDNACLSKSLSLCEQSVKELADLVNELDEKIKDKGGFRKKFGGLKVVLKKDDLKRSKSRMKSAISLLSLAQQCHMLAMIQLQPDIMTARLASHIQVASAIQDSGDATVELIPSDKTDTSTSSPQDLVTRQNDTWIASTPWMQALLGSFEYHSQVKSYKGESRQEFDARYRLPFWMSRTAFRVQGHNYLSTWRINYQSYRIMPDDSPFFEAIEDGNIPAVQDMLSKKTAFVTDRNQGWDATPLHLAIRSGSVDMCKLLLAEGADPAVSDDDDMTPLEYLFFIADHLAFGQNKQPLELLRVLSNSTANNALYENDGQIWFDRGPIEMFRYLQNQLYPPYYQRAITERMQWAAAIAYFSNDYHNCSELVELALSPDGAVTSEMALWVQDSEVDPSRSTMLHYLAEAVAHSHGTEGYYDGDLYHGSKELIELLPKEVGLDGNIYLSYSQMFRPLIQRFVNAGADVHALNICNETPLRKNLFGLHIAHKSSLAKLIVWLTALHECGIDLQLYGDTERLLGTFAFSEDHYFRGLTRFAGMTYGPLPSDWRIWYAEPTDRYAGEFWESISEGVWNSGLEESDEEDIECLIPGAWEDEDEG